MFIGWPWVRNSEWSGKVGENRFLNSEASSSLPYGHNCSVLLKNLLTAKCFQSLELQRRKLSSWSFAPLWRHSGWALYSGLFKFQANVWPCLAIVTADAHPSSIQSLPNTDLTSYFFLFNVFFLIFIYFWLCWVSSCSECRLLSSWGACVFIVVASFVAEHRL